MNRLLSATVLPIIDGVGFAIVEVQAQAALGWVKPIWDPSLSYLISMFIVLSTPWVYFRNFWLWLYSTTIAFWAEDVFYWVFTWEPPHAWSLYPMWYGIPIDYVIAIAIIAMSLTMYGREEIRI